jgi:hypothetical protein
MGRICDFIVSIVKLVIRTWFPKPRWKTYAAQSGYVYQYVFEGLKDEREYLFRAVSGEQIEMNCSVEFSAQTWIGANRELSDIERYGIAKIALLRSLDEPEPPTTLRSIRPSESEVADICRELDL